MDSPDHLPATPPPPPLPLLPASRSPARARWACAALAGVALLPFLLAPFMEATPEHASLCGIEGPRCPGRLVFGEHGCPGCGLTRGWVLITHGAWRAGIRANPAVPWLMVLAAGAALQNAFAAMRGRAPPGVSALNQAGRRVLVAIILGAWLARWGGFL